MATISYNGTTFFDQSSTGLAWRYSGPASIRKPVIEVKAVLGDGYWLKPSGQEAVDHRIVCTWKTSSPATLKTSVEAIRGTTRASLVLPIYGTLTNCRLESIDWSDPQKTNGSDYVWEATLTFRQYP